MELKETGPSEDSLNQRLLDEMHCNIHQRTTKSQIIKELWNSINGYYYVIPRLYLFICLLPFIFRTNHSIFSSFVEGLPSQMMYLSC